MATDMKTLDPSALPDVTSTVIYNPSCETVIMPGLPAGLTSVAGITVVTGGTELSCASCMMAFCFWKTVVGFSCVAVGLWDQVNQSRKEMSHLLGIGLVILAITFVVMGSIAAYSLLKKKRRQMTQEQKDDGREVLVENSGVIKKVTV